MINTSALQVYDYFLTHYGYTRWRQVLLTLGFHNNIVNGYRVYIQAFHNLSKGKYFTSPADADDLIHKLHDNKLLYPMSFNPQPERLFAIGIINYNPHHIDSLNNSPVAGHYVDWDWKVVFRVHPALAHAHDLEHLNV